MKWLIPFAGLLRRIRLPCIAGQDALFQPPLQLHQRLMLLQLNGQQLDAGDAGQPRAQNVGEGLIADNHALPAGQPQPLGRPQEPDGQRLAGKGDKSQPQLACERLHPLAQGVGNHRGRKARRLHGPQPGQHGRIQRLAAVGGQGVIDIQQQPPHAQSAQILRRNGGHPFSQVRRLRSIDSEW